MASYKDIKKKHEEAVAKDFVEFANSEDAYFLDEMPDPPDAILRSKSGRTLWLEITDIFRSASEAKQAYSQAAHGASGWKRPQEVIVNPDDQINLSTIEGIERKIEKDSYKETLKKFGKGVLILWVYDPLFTEETLRKIIKSFEGKPFSSNYFKSVYLNHPEERSNQRVITKLL